MNQVPQPQNGFLAFSEAMDVRPDSAVRIAFERYADQLVDLARRHLPRETKAKFDPEDVVQSTMRSFFRRQRRQGFELTSWDSVWGLLARISLRKCSRRKTHHFAQKRDARKEVTLSAAEADSSVQAWHVDPCAPTLAEATQLWELLQDYLGQLSPLHREILSLHLSGMDVTVIAENVHRTRRTVNRVLRIVREGLESALRESNR